MWHKYRRNVEGNMLTSLRFQRRILSIDISTSGNFCRKRISVSRWHASENHHRWMRIVLDALQLQVFVNVKIVAVKSFLHENFSCLRGYFVKVLCSNENASVEVLQNLWSLDNVTWCYFRKNLSCNLTLVFLDFRIVSFSCIIIELEKSPLIGRRSITIKSELVLLTSTTFEKL